MALTQCPSCNKRISDKAKVCPHCEFKLGGLTAEERDREWERVYSRKKDRLLSQSMLALLLAIAAFAYYYVAQPMPESWQAQVSYGIIAVGLVWFIVSRVRLVMLKKRPR